MRFVSPIESLGEFHAATLVLDLSKNLPRTRLRLFKLSAQRTREIPAHGVVYADLVLNRA